MHDYCLSTEGFKQSARKHRLTEPSYEVTPTIT
jgi:hypothetical protein